MRLLRLRETLLLLLLLLLLALLLKLLHLLLNLLWSTLWPAEGAARRHRVLRRTVVLFHILLRRILLRRHILVFLLIAGLHAGIGRRRRARCAGAQNDVLGRLIACAADHQYVVTGTVEQLGKHFARRARAVIAEDALILVESFQLGAGIGCYFVEDLVQAGV